MDEVVYYLLSGIFMFFVGSMLGWCVEVVYRRMFTAKKWINPGFLTGPYLPLYGFGTVVLFAITCIPINTGSAVADAVIKILIMGVSMTAIEYIAGLIFIKGMKIRLWDYSNQWGNLQGIICPLYSFFWLLVAVGFYFLVTPSVRNMIYWFVEHIEFAYVVGVLSGVFLVDFCHAIHLSAKISRFAKERKIVVHTEKLKAVLSDRIQALKNKRPSFMFPLSSFDSHQSELEADANKFDASENKRPKSTEKAD